MQYKILLDTHLQHWPSKRLAALIGGEGSSLKSEMLAKVLLSKLLTGCCLSLSFEGLGAVVALKMILNESPFTSYVVPTQTFQGLVCVSDGRRQK